MPKTGLDYFGARYFGAAQARFTSPDPLGASGRAEKPQSWNRFAYVLNNPLRLIDPTGMVDSPATPEFEAKFRKADPTMYEVVKASNNYSQSQFEEDVRKGRGVNNTTYGLAGESVVIDSYRKTLSNVHAQSTGVSPEGPPENGRSPDIGAIAPSIRTPEGSITSVALGVATKGGGAIESEIRAPNLYVFSEVKTGQVSAGRVADAIIQVDSAPVVNANRAISAPLVVVDANQWHYGVSSQNKAALVGFAAALGVRIQLMTGLNKDAANRVSNLVNAVR